MEEITLEITIKAAIIKDENKVLLIKRAKGDNLNPGKYDLPGGHIEVGEDFEEALRREIIEETGIEVKIGQIISASSFRENKKGLRYVAFYRSGEVELSKAHSKYEWIEIEKAIDRLGDDHFEAEKKETLIRAKEYLDQKEAVNNWKRCLADFENYKKRQEKSQGEFRKYAKEDVVLQLLPILDNFHTSTEHVPENQQDDGWVVGIMHIQKQLENSIKESGVEEIKIKVGEKFDPQLHEAVDSGNKKTLKNKVAKIISRGYKLNGKVVRPVKVVVE